MSEPSVTGYQSLTPAYGRVYNTATEARNAFLGGSGFILHTPLGSTYCSIRDFVPGSSTANIRYGKGLGQIVVVPVVKAV